MRIALVSPFAKVPERATAGSVGYDLFAAIESEVRIWPGQIAVIPTGVCLELPEGFEGQVRSRSGLSSKHGVTLVNSPGTIDWDYRGEIKVPLINLGQKSYLVRPQERIAQLVFARVETPSLVVVKSLSSTARGDSGFGSTGK